MKTKKLYKTQPTHRIIIIITCAIIILLFFIPFGQSNSPFSIFKEVSNSMGKNSHDNITRVLSPLLGLPLCSVIPLFAFILLAIEFIGKPHGKLTFFKILMLCVMPFYFGFLSVFSNLGIGFYLTLFCVLYLFITLFLNIYT